MRKKYVMIYITVMALICAALIIRDQNPQTRGCRLCGRDVPAGVYLLGTDTGALYPLDLSGEEVPGVSVSYAGGERPGESLEIIRLNSQKSGETVLRRKKRSADTERIRELYCDACARKIMDAVAGQPSGDCVLFDAEKLEFYPETEGVLQIGEIRLEITDGDGERELLIRQERQGLM